MTLATSRLRGEHRTDRTLFQLLCALIIWYRSMTALLPRCGSAAWWGTVIALLPGICTALLFRCCMRLTHTGTLPEAMRACLGAFGLWALAIVLGLTLLLEGTSLMTALMTVFTEGIGTRGTRLTLAVLTGAILLGSLHREGLARGIHLLRYAMLAALALTVLCLLQDAHIDALYPPLGAGTAAISAALRAESGIGWAFTLVLLLPYEEGQNRFRAGIAPVCIVVLLLLCTQFTLPDEVLRTHPSLAETLLLPLRFAPNALRVLGCCLLMLVFFLGVGASAQKAASVLCMPCSQPPRWLPYAITGAFILSQAIRSSTLWDFLRRWQGWTLLPLLLLALISLPIALFRRRSP